MIKIPGLIDIHVHLREPGETYKEDFSSGTAAALAGGFTTILVMPNTSPPLVDRNSFQIASTFAERQATCDYGIYLGGNGTNAQEITQLSHKAVGLKLYLDATYGPLLLQDTSMWAAHFEHWPHNKPIVAHAEQKTLAAYLFFAQLYQRPVHVCHVSRREEINLIKAAKDRGVQVTCEVTPHHLFLTREDIPALGIGRAEVRPRLASPEDQLALWDNLDSIDCIATDHAPHTLEEKESREPPPGYPGLETALPLLLTAVHEGRLRLDDLIEKMVINPRRIFNLPVQPDTWVEIEENWEYTIEASKLKTKCRWTPFEGWRVRGLVHRVVLRGETVYLDGKILAQPGFGKNVC